MAPTIPGARRARGSRGRAGSRAGSQRNAHTNAGVGRHRSGPTRGSGSIRNRSGAHDATGAMLGRYRVVREHEHRHGHEHTEATRQNTGRSRPSLLSRMTFTHGGFQPSELRPEYRDAIAEHSDMEVDQCQSPVAEPDDSALATTDNSKLSRSESQSSATASMVTAPQVPSIETTTASAPPSVLPPKAASKSTRPINTYRGNDPIKRLVSNKKLRAILGDKPLPKERKKHPDDRMELRLGISRTMK